MDRDAISVRLLGGFSIHFGDAEIGSLPPQATSLLAYLLVNRHRPQTRDLLAGRFWGDLPDDRARKRLSNSLWQIKSAAVDSGLPELLDAAAGEIKVTSKHEISIDSEDFEARLGEFERDLRTRQVRGVLADRLADLLAEYEGDFLAGHYHDWIERERDRIRERYHAALAELVRCYKASSQYDLALRFAHKLVKEEPLREDLHREVMRLHALLGQASAAERQFDTCRRELDGELGVEPSAETVELIERIRTDSPPERAVASQVHAESSALVGRSKEMAVLSGRADELIGGQGGVILLEGNPGIGKSRLVEEFVDAAEWRGSIRILSAGHTELSTMRPYETLREALAPAVTGLRGEHLAELVEPVWLRQAAEIFPDLERFLKTDEPSRPLRPEEEPARMSEALVRVINAQGAIAPTLIVLEDIHWADDDSIQVLAQLGARLARNGVLLCLTYRRFEAEQSASIWSGISQLEVLPSATRIVLSPLNVAEVRELIHARIGPGGLPREAMSQVIAQTDGNPLYVLESLRNPTSLLADDDAERLAEVLQLPPSVARSLEARLEAFDLPVRTVLEGLAALAEAAGTSVVAEIAGLERTDTIRALTEAVQAGFLVEDDQTGSCRFAHDQSRRVVYELIEPGDRSRLHGRIYEALVQDGDQKAEQLAHHARLADRMEDAYRWHRTAAQDALAVNGYRTAAEHFAQADEAAGLAGLELVERAQDLLLYEGALDVLGRREDQTVVLKQLRELSLPVELELALIEREAWLLLNTDKPDEAERLVVPALEDAETAGLPKARLLTVVGVARTHTADFRGALAPLHQAMEEAVDKSSLILAQTLLGKAHVELMDYSAGERHLKEALATAHRIGDVRGEIEALGYHAVGKALAGQADEAADSLTDAIELSRSIGYRYGEAVNLVNLARHHLMRGSGGQALDLFEGAAEIFGSLSNARGEAFVKLSAAELHHRLLGEDEKATELANSAAVFFRRVDDHPHEALALAVLSSIDLRQGRRRLARRRLRDMLDRAIREQDVETEIQIRRGLANVELAAGDHRAAADHLDQVLAQSEKYPIEPALPNVLAFRAFAALRMNDKKQAEEFGSRASMASKPSADLVHVTAWLCSEVFAFLGMVQESDAQIELGFDYVNRSLVGLPADLRYLAWSAVPEYESIRESYERRFVRLTEVRLPAKDAPTGRPLVEDEYVDVTWTISDPTDWDEPSAAKRRQEKIDRLTGQAIRQGAVARIVDLAEALSVSERTIKRDIAKLREAGKSPRTRKSA